MEVFPSTRTAVRPYLVIDVRSKSTYWMYLKQSGGPHTAAQMFDDMFTPSTSFLARSWFCCDEVAAALPAESLLFALRRRDGNDTAFNVLGTSRLLKKSG